MKTENISKRNCRRRKGRAVGWSREVKKKRGGKQTEGEGRMQRKMEGGGKDMLVT